MHMLNVHSIETFGTHDGPGIRLVVFTQGCPWRCVYCHNPDTQAVTNSQAKMMSAPEILALLDKQRPFFKDTGGLTISGGEPTLQAAALQEIFTLAKAKGYHVTLDTNGMVHSRVVNQVYDLSDLVILDVKHINPHHHQEVTGGGYLHPVLKNAEYREASGKPLWLRYVLVPGWTDQPQHVKAWAEYFKNYTTLEQVHILPYHTLGVHKYQELGRPYQLTGVQPPTAVLINQVQSVFSTVLPHVQVVVG